MESVWKISIVAILIIAFSIIGAESQLAKCWSTVGSAGTVDEADLGIVSLDTHTAGVSESVKSGTVHIRYNVVAVDGVFGGNCKLLSARIADNGPEAQVIVELKQMNSVTGAFQTLAKLDSNNFEPSHVAQFREVFTELGIPEFDFRNNVYLLDVQLIKTGINGTPLIRSAHICPGTCGVE